MEELIKKCKLYSLKAIENGQRYLFRLVVFQCFVVFCNFFIDEIRELEDNHVTGVKYVHVDEYYFKGHFPNAPVMPGVLQIEAMAQTGGILALNSVPDPENYLTYFMKIDKVKFKQKVEKYQI